MKIRDPFLLLVTALVVPGCGPHQVASPDALANDSGFAISGPLYSWVEPGGTSYQDLNGDGAVDVQTEAHVGGTKGTRIRKEDRDFDGFYDTEHVTRGDVQAILSEKVIREQVPPMDLSHVNPISPMSPWKLPPSGTARSKP